MAILKRSFMILIILSILLNSFGIVFASSHNMPMDDQMQSMDERSEMNMDSDMGMSGMDMGNSKYDTLNRISYPVTLIVSLIAFWICIVLIKFTGMKDKFGLIAVGLLMFFVQSIFGVLHYATNPKGQMITMPTLMFVMSFFTSLGLIFIAIAFYKWKKMLNA